MKAHRLSRLGHRRLVATKEGTIRGPRLYDRGSLALKDLTPPIAAVGWLMKSCRTAFSAQGPQKARELTYKFRGKQAVRKEGHIVLFRTGFPNRPKKTGDIWAGPS